MPSIKKVFLSSTWIDLQESRTLAAKALSHTNEYFSDGMESFGSQDYPPLDLCLQRVRECDLYLGILGHRYGSRPPGHSESFTELEYKEAVALGKPRILFFFDGPLKPDHLEPDDLRQKQLDFRARASLDRAIASFTQPQELTGLVLAALFNLRSAQSRGFGFKSVLLFPFLSSVKGFNSGISISNACVGPGQAELTSGVVRLYFSGDGPSGKVLLEQRSSRAVPAGSTLSMNLLFGNADWGFEPISGFQGYAYAVCNFAPARGFAYISDPGNQLTAAGYLAELMPPEFLAVL